MKQMSEIEKLRMQIYVLEGQNAFNKEYLAYLHNMISSMESDNEESKPFERKRFPGLYDGLAQVLEFEDDEDDDADDEGAAVRFLSENCQEVHSWGPSVKSMVGKEAMGGGLVAPICGAWGFDAGGICPGAAFPGGKGGFPYCGGTGGIPGFCWPFG